MSTSFFGPNSATTPVATRLGKSLITLPGGDNLVCAACQFQFGRKITMVSPLNLTKRILTASEPQGSLVISFLVGPSKGISSFLSKYADECSVKNTGNNILITPAEECDGVTKTRWTFMGNLLEGIQGTINRTEQGNLVIPSVSMFFTDFHMDD